MTNFKHLLLLFLILTAVSCHKKANEVIEQIPPKMETNPNYLYSIKMEKDIQLGDYFEFMDSLVQVENQRTPYELSEYLIVHTNPNLITAFAESDYSFRKRKGDFVYDNRSLVMLQKGDSLWLPSEEIAGQLFEQQAQTTIDINVPEFKLRIKIGDKVPHTFPVRVGQNRVRYLETAGRDEDLRTKTGIGEIAKINRNPKFINPVDGKEFFVTRRDDDEITRMPQIPWLHPMIDCHLWGQMIHPTSNPKTLGKTYSNGCIGTDEAAAWYTYFYAPIGTKVVIRYDLEIINEQVETTRLKDIYGKKGSVRMGEPKVCFK